MESKLAYLLSSGKKFVSGKGKTCPCCGYEHSDTVSRKLVVTSLCRCRNCKLLFRTPTTSFNENKTFYQKAYKQGFTTETPPLQELQALKAKNFSGSAKDYMRYINVLTALAKPGASVFDFGCSWGYGSYQMSRAGFGVEAYEISDDRRQYAQKNLGVKVYDKLPENKAQSYDIFFSAHVLEHVPSVLDSMAYGFSVLKPGGYFVAFTPNGSEAFRQRCPDAWMKLWNRVHPNFLDDCFYIMNSGNNPFLLTSNLGTHSNVKQWKENGHGRTIEAIGGDELLFIARKPDTAVKHQVETERLPSYTNALAV